MYYRAITDLLKLNNFDYSDSDCGDGCHIITVFPNSYNLRIPIDEEGFDIDFTYDTTQSYSNFPIENLRQVLGLILALEQLRRELK